MICFQNILSDNVLLCFTNNHQYIKIHSFIILIKNAITKAFTTKNMTKNPKTLCCVLTVQENHRLYLDIWLHISSLFSLYHTCCFSV